MKAGIILNSNMWQKVHDLRLKWDEKDGRNRSFFPLADEHEGDLWWEGLFQFYNERDGDLHLLYEVLGVPSYPTSLKKRTVFFIKVWL